MKNLVLIAVMAFAVAFIGTGCAAQKGTPKVQTETFKVKGICGMCKDRIEKAALIKGVKMATWTKETDDLKVIFNPRKVSLKEIQQSIAEAGHDNDGATASDEAYDGISGCCKYRTQEKH